MNKYEIHIGEIFDLTTNSKKPKQTLIITQDQFAVIEQFADQRKDAELNTIYRLNECEFRIFPHFDLGADKSEFEKLKERAIKLGLRVENMSELQMIAYLLMIYERMSDSTVSEYG